MPPCPCQHCGNNFMMPDPTFEGLRICNNCIIKNELRNSKEKKMDEGYINILIRFPKDYQAKIEEDCVAKGIDFSKFFLNLYEASQKNIHYQVMGEELTNLEYPKSIDEKKENYHKKGKKNE